MKLLQVPPRQLVVPTDAWSLLPPAEALLPTDAAPTLFLWGAAIGEEVWAWTASGAPWTATEDTAALPLLMPSLPSDAAPELCAYGLYLLAAFSRRPAQPVEWVHALSLLRERFHWDIATKKLPPLWPEALKAAGLEPDLKTLLPFQPFTALNLAEKRLLFAQSWHPLALESVEQLPTAVRATLLQALSIGSFTEEAARECVHSILQIQKRYGDKAATEVLGKTQGSGDSLRSSLTRIAQPELARLSDDRIALLRSLHLPPRTAVHGDPHFERDTLKITFVPQSLGDWETFKDWVVDENTADKMRELLENP